MTIAAVVEVACAGGQQPVEVRLRAWGELETPDEPFNQFGRAWGGMIPDECHQQYPRVREALEASAPLMVERVLLQQQASHDDLNVARLWQSLLDAMPNAEQVAREQLSVASPDTPEAEWAVAVAGTQAQLADFLEACPITRWRFGNQLWLLRRAIQGDHTVWKFLWDVLPKLRDALQEAESLVAVAMGLGQSNSDRAWDTLEPMLTHADPAVRAAAVAAVGSLRETRARDHLRAAVQHEQEAAVKTQIIAALGAIGEAQDADTLIEYALHHPRYRAAVRDALVALAAVAIPPIHNALRDTFDDTLRELLINALREIHLPEVVSPLSWAAQHAESIKVRQQAVQALAELPYEDVIPALVHALGDVSERTRNIALDALVQRGEAAAQLLLEYLENPQWSPEQRYLAQWAAARALARIGGETVKQRLIDLAEGYDLNQRWAALTAIRYADYPDLTETIIQHIPSSPWTIQHECALYLRKYPLVDAIPVLMDELRQADAAVQEILEAAIVANGVAAIPILQRHSNEWHAFGQRKAIVSILKQIGHPAGRPLLEELAQDSDPRIAEAAREAIKHIETGVPS